jgi:hypothetical protein
VREARTVEAAEAARLIHEAAAAQRRARREQALRMLDGCADWPAPYNEQALLIRAEILTYQDPVAGLEALAANADAFTSPEGRFGYLTESARAYTKARNFDLAQAMLDAAEAMLQGSEDPRRAKVAHHRTRLLWTTGNYDPQSELFAYSLRDPDPAARVAALVIRGGMHGGLENYRAQLDDLKAALRLFLEHQALCDVSVAVAALQTTLYLGFEMGEEPASVLGAQVFDEIDWSDELQVYRFLCVRGLAWNAFLEGESARAQWLFKDSKDVAPTNAWKVMAHVDRAFVARMNLNEAWATEELHQAHALARGVDWQATRDEERMALMTLAVMFAPVDMPQAQRYVSTYIRLGKDSLDPTLSAAHDPARTKAMQKYASGCVQLVLGNKDVAIGLLESAYETFSQIEFAFRAALTAQALYDATNKETWLQMARAHAGKYEKSALRERLHSERPASDKPFHLLTPSQRQIALAYSGGAELEELSHKFSRSTFTLQKQLESIYSALKVKNRTALRDELHRQGLL